MSTLERVFFPSKNNPCFASGHWTPPGRWLFHCYSMCFIPYTYLLPRSDWDVIVHFPSSYVLIMTWSSWLSSSQRHAEHGRWVTWTFTAYLFLVKHLDPVDAWLQTDLVNLLVEFTVELAVFQPALVKSNHAKAHKHQMTSASQTLSHEY